jgi:hypothetical protein
MDNTAALADVIADLTKAADMKPHGLAVEAGIPWSTFDRRFINRPNKPAQTGARLGELERIAAVLDKRPSELLALAEERMALQAA